MTLIFPFRAKKYQAREPSLIFLFDMYSLIVCMWLIAIPLALAGAFALHWSPLAVYACTCLDEVGKIPWVMLRFRKYKWVQDLTR